MVLPVDYNNQPDILIPVSCAECVDPGMARSTHNKLYQVMTPQKQLA